MTSMHDAESVPDSGTATEEPVQEPCDEHCFCMATFSFPPKVTCCRCGETRLLLARVPKRMQPRLRT